MKLLECFKKRRRDNAKREAWQELRSHVVLQAGPFRDEMTSAGYKEILNSDSASPAAHAFLSVLVTSFLA